LCGGGGHFWGGGSDTKTVEGTRERTFPKTNCQRIEQKDNVGWGITG